jgi:uncharacterized membrane protein
VLGTDVYMVLLRIVHIATGVIWVGSLFVVVVFIQPTAATLGSAGGPFMSELRRRRFVDVVFIDAVVTVVVGGFLYWRDWHAVHPRFHDWIDSRFGAALTVSAMVALCGLGVAALVTRPTIARLVSLAHVAASRGTPSPGSATQIGALQRRLVVAERASFSLVLLAVVAMASARYL